jgi:ankyrin repeat protein
LDELPDDFNDDYIESEIIDLCGALVEVREGNTQEQPGSRTVHLVHPSVRDFLLSALSNHQKILSDEPVIFEHEGGADRHQRYLATTCLAYMKYDNVWNGSENSQGSINECAFLDYAARFWHLHLDSVVKDDSWKSQIMSDFFQTGNSPFSQWAKYFESYPQAKDREEKAVGTPMYYAALFNFHTIMESIWVEDKKQIDVVGGRYGTPLQAACVKHNEKAFEKLIRWGTDANTEGGEFGVALIAAAAGGFKDMVTILCTNGAELNTRDSMGRTALYTAAKNGFKDVVDILWKAGAQIEIKNKHGWTPINSAADNGHLEVVRLLLNQGADAAIPNENGWTPINSAADNGHLEVVRILLDQGVDATTPNDAGWRPINSAASNGHLKVVQLLLDRGADAAIPNKRGWTPINSAADEGHLEVVRLLLDRGADAVIPSERGWTPINSAASNGHLKVVQLLLDRGADASIPNEDGWTPINSAASNGHLKVVQLLLDRGTDANKPNNFGSTPINSAARKGHFELVQLLLDQGGDCTTRNKSLETVFHSAALSGNVKVFNLLVEFIHGPLDILKPVEHDSPGDPRIVGPILSINSTPRMAFDVNATCNHYGTAVHVAAFKGHLSFLQALVEVHRADVTVKDQMGRTPLHLAARSGNIDCLNYLLNLDQGLHCSDTDLAGNGVIYYACSSGSLETTQRVLEIERITIPDSNKWSPLHWACRTGDIGLIELLIKTGGYETSVSTAEPLASWDPVAIAVYHGNSKLESSTEPSLSALLRTPISSPAQSDSTSTCEIVKKGARHTSFWCNSCFHVSSPRHQESILNLKQEIYGPRFYCTACYEIDFCFMCNFAAQDMHPGHELQMIEPVQGETQA